MELIMKMEGVQMIARLVFTALILTTVSIAAFAQNANSSTTKVRPRTANTSATQTPTPKTEKPAQSTNRGAGAQTPGSDAVMTAFNKIIDGIKKTNVDLVMSGYAKEPSPIFFNYNGTVTKGWDQMRQNRESSYKEIKDVKLDVRDVHVTMLGRDGAVVTCLWTQAQTYKGAPDNASGRMTLVFKRVGTEWKAVHLHTSPDKPDASRVPASEQIPSPTPKP
jgi:ketosteroid isomerase-like protein